ncbi:DNA (cytosine-5-)-methyltransferase [Streptomyces sp. NPDC006798]|uniref:DNA cytosine methyltransferase n=1 Tax=Streptomyces sp. NPDC006798 TaxID=3155462 RepID=UPI00341075FC
MSTGSRELTSIEICAGAGGQALGLHRAGFRHLALVEVDPHAAESLRENIRTRRDWAWERKKCRVLEGDVKKFQPIGHILNPDLDDRTHREFSDDEALRRLREEGGAAEKEKYLLAPGRLDLLAGGVPCPPFSVAGKQLGMDDDRDLFPEMLGLVEELRPRAVMIENVRGLVEPEVKFRYYRNQIKNRLRKAGYVICGWRVLEAGDFGVPQLRPRAILVAIREDCYRGFDWPVPQKKIKTVFAALENSMARRLGGRESELYQQWEREVKNGTVAPTLVGGSKRHGGADLGPTRAKRAWERLGVDAMGVANDEDKMVDSDRDLGKIGRGPKLTVAQAAIIQGFPEDWIFSGGKTARYRQVGNAFPPPVAAAVGEAIKDALARTGPLHDDPDPGFEPEGDPSDLDTTIPFQPAFPAFEDDTADHGGALVR